MPCPSKILQVTDHYYPVCLHVLFRGEPFDHGLVHAIESVIIEWTHQIQSVLKRNSAQPLLEGHNPGPLVELDFWKARAMNLECIFEQVSSLINHSTNQPTNQPLNQPTNQRTNQTVSQSVSQSVNFI